MPAALSPEPGAGPGANDELDDLFADLIGEDASNDASNQPSRDQPDNMDEEIKITKKRKPVAKLDESRLLSAAGIPKLRKISKDKLKFRGKGNEFTDMSRLLNTYQLWLDDLFPKAKFVDGLTMIEKLGHKKKIQMYRKEWIDEGKPRNFQDDIDDFVASREEEPSRHATEHTSEHSRDRPTSSSGEQHVDSQDNSRGLADPARLPADVSEPDEDELDALLREAAGDNNRLATGASEAQPDDEEPDEDELDALLAEDDVQINNNGPKSIFGGPVSSESVTRQQSRHDFADEEDAMAEMDW